jgi:hypothetical protein
MDEPIKVTKEAVKAQIESESMDRAARYAQGGRRFAGLLVDVLAHAWAEAGWKCVRDITNRQLRSDFLDLASEFELRGYTRIPSDDAIAVLDAFVAASAKHAEERGALDPEGEAEHGEKLLVQFEKFMRAKTRSN